MRNFFVFLMLCLSIPAQGAPKKSGLNKKLLKVSEGLERHEPLIFYPDRPKQPPVMHIMKDSKEMQKRFAPMILLLPNVDQPTDGNGENALKEEALID